MTPPTLAVSEVFGPTFQGEGAFLGRRAGFVRLARCNLDCRWCDTPYTWDWNRFDPAEEIREMTVGEVLDRLDHMAIDRVVVTGGEPLLQQRRLLPLLEAFSQRAWTVEVETNGTVVPEPDIVGLVTAFNVSPKLANSGIAEQRRLRPDALRSLAGSGRAAFKFVVTSTADLEEIEAVVERHQLHPVWVMPEGTDPGRVLDGLRTVAELVLERGWNLSPRLHVLVWGDERGR